MIRPPPTSTRMKPAVPTRRSSDLRSLRRRDMKQRAMFGPVRRIEHRRAVADAARQYVIDHRAVHALDVTRPLRRAASTRLESEQAAMRSRQTRSEEHTSELQSLMRNSYAVFCLKKKKTNKK